MQITECCTTRKAADAMGISVYQANTAWRNFRKKEIQSKEKTTGTDATETTSRACCR
ncbi:hypothetical protein E9G51_004694 [Escherichia coli]|nr:hypothetical protein [Escherichia coli]EGB2977796.1 hypothetical protein [Escherichia coli]